MTYEDQRVVTRTEDHVSAPVGHSVSETTVTHRPNPLRIIERVVIFVFGVIQALLVMRIVLILLDAREGNPIVEFIYELSDLFVAPFRGMFALDSAGGEVVAAIVALIGWTVLELLILALLRIFRPSATA